MSIHPINNNGSAILRFTYQGKRYSLSGFGKFSDAIAIAKCQAIAAKIQADIALNVFDTSLASYKQSLAQPIDSKGKKGKDSDDDTSIAKLLNRFIQYKDHCGDVSNSRIRQFMSLAKFVANTEPVHKNDHASLIQTACKQWETYRVRVLISLMRQAYEWQSRTSDVSIPDWESLGKLLPRTKKGDGDIDLIGEINPFSEVERDTILEYVRSDERYSDYWHYIAFLFFTGCRPGEASGLRWNAVNGKTITFRESITQYDHSQRLKTQKSRTISINSTVSALLESLKRRGDDELVFSIDGTHPITARDVSAWRWKRILDACGIPHRKFYNCRHTFATLAIKRGVSPQILARHLGNSVAIIDKYYCGDTSDVIIE